jgi:hypothetical protein
VIGVETIREAGEGAIASERIEFTGVAGPFAAHDVVYGQDGALAVAGSSFTDRAIPGGDGEPTGWIDRVATAAGLDETLVGNSGAFFAADRDGRFVGEDDLLPILFEDGQTQPLPLPPGYAIGSASDINGDRIVGYANQDAIAWEQTQSGWSPRILAHREGDSFGVANSVSALGIAGGSYLRTIPVTNPSTARELVTQQSANAEGVGSKEIGILWNRDGTVLREFDLDTDASVTRVIDFLAAVDRAEGTQLYDPRTETLTDLHQFLRDVAGLDVPQQPLRLVDLEWSADREQLLFLFETVESTEPSMSRQFVAAVDADDLPSSWQSPWDRHDVNADGRVSVLDALLVINRLGRDPSPVLPGEGTRDGPFYDTTGDARVSTLDALHVINRIARDMG